MKLMMEQSMVRASLMVLIFTFVASQLMTSVSARYLPTRSQEDRLDKLRELLKDLLESDYERRAPMIDYSDPLLAPGHPGSGIYKRSASLSDKEMEPTLKAMDRFDVAGRIPSSILMGAQNIRRSMK